MGEDPWEGLPEDMAEQFMEMQEEWDRKRTLEEQYPGNLEDMRELVNSLHSLLLVLAKRAKNGSIWITSREIDAVHGRHVSISRLSHGGVHIMAED